MTVVGVTGKYCAGKSTVAQKLAAHGYHEIDVDALGHEALSREADAVVARFGESVRGSDGSVDRKALGRIVFSSSSELRALEAIVHPAMVQMVRERVESAPRERTGVAINAAILFRMGLDELCTTVLYVTAPFFVRFLRARRRDGATLRDFIRRLRSQRDVAPQFSRHSADIQRVVNNGDAERLVQQLQEHVPLP